MALIPTVQAKLSGTTVTYTAAAGGGDTVNILSPHTEIRVKNGSGAGITVTLVVPGNTEFGQAQPDIAVAVAAGAEVVIGPVPQSAEDPTTGVANLTYSSATSVTVAAVAL